MLTNKKLDCGMVTWSRALSYHETYGNSCISYGKFANTFLTSEILLTMSEIHLTISELHLTVS
jgi:hypothetical protein